MPRLNHRKTRTGCQRCKARKVKCDEARPRCSACARHNVPCEYTTTTPRSVEQYNLATPPTDIPYNTSPPGTEEYVRELDPLLELRLMHAWTAYTCKTFSTAWEFWCYQAPLVALEFRYVLDAMLAMASLHASRQPTAPSISMEGRVVPIRDPLYNPAHPERDISVRWKKLDDPELMANMANVADAINSSGKNSYLETKRSLEMLNISRMYFDRAIDGHRRALGNLTVENIEAVYMTSVLVSFAALFTLSESDEDPTLSVDPRQWLRLGRGTLFIVQRWEQMIGDAWMVKAGIFYGKPDLTDDDTLFAIENGRPFHRLLTFAEDFEAMTDEDRNAYRKTLRYMGLLYKSIVEGSDTPVATCRRIIGLPSRCPARFVDLVEANSPRALVMLAHAFACMKLVDENKVMWFKGMAERQVPKIYEQLPVGWREMMAWPMAIARGEIDREPRETYIDDILDL